MDSTSRIYERAQRVLPGGVTAAARLNRYLGRPFIVSRADGSRLYDVDGRELIDVCTSFGASLLGHRHPAIVEALVKAGEMGIACAMEFPQQVELAEKLSSAVPSAEMVRFTMSGTETTWYAVRLARVHTGKTKIVKMEGHFHGYNDYLQYNYWPAPGKGLPKLQEETPGFPPEAREHVIVLPYNDIEAVEELVAARGDEIAGIILEPVNYNSGGILPRDGYLPRLRTITEENNILLIFDEILSGFRTGTDCIQGYYGVTPDITTLGKAIGGGVPLSAFVGRRAVMESVAPLGAMMHSGTYNANASTIFCGNAFMDAVAQPGVYDALLERSEKFYVELNGVFTAAGFPARVCGLGARCGILFGEAASKDPESYADVAGQDWNLGRAFFREAFDRGVFFNNGWHQGLSFAHSDSDVDQILSASGAAARSLAGRKPAV
jgi:glutamate-1-semialdehyde 2,1-aminomutase